MKKMQETILGRLSRLYREKAMISLIIALGLLAAAIWYQNSWFWILPWCVFVYSLVKWFKLIRLTHQAKQFVRRCQDDEKTMKQIDTTFFVESHFYTWYRDKGSQLRYSQIESCTICKVILEGRMLEWYKPWHLTLRLESSDYTILQMDSEKQCLEVVQFLLSKNPSIKTETEILRETRCLDSLQESHP